MPNLNRLPTEDDGLDGLLDMAGRFGYEEFFNFVGMLRNDDPNSPAGTIRTAIARHLIEQELGGPADHTTPERPGRPADTPYNNARRVVAERLGIPLPNRTNFYKIVRGESRPRSA